MTRTQIIGEICDNVGKSRSATSVSATNLEDRVVNYLNWAQKRIARHYSFQELDILLTTAATVADIKRYPIESGTNNLGLVRPKDIQTIRLIDGENSRKLARWSTRKFDTKIPRPENYSTGRPSVYIRHGNFLELFRIPDAVYSMSVRYPQWPLDLSAAGQYTDFKDKDQLLVTAGTLETYLALEEYADAKVWYDRFEGQLTDAVRAEGNMDWEPQAEPMNLESSYTSGEPYYDPFGDVGDPLYGYPG